MTEQDVLQKLRPLIFEVTGVPEQDIAMSSVLMNDLGAESIDLLDLSFLIEERFGITIEANEFERQASAELPDDAYEQDGFLTAAALEKLRQALPEIAPDKLSSGLRKVDLPALLTVGVFVHLIQRKLAARAEEVTDA